MKVQRVFLVLLAVAASAQAPPPTVPAPPQTPTADVPAPPRLQNTGQPMRVPVVCGDDEIHAFGLNCSAEQPCPLYLELSDLKPLGVKLFASGNLHTPSSTLWSILLASEDGGKSWFEPFERLRSAMLDQIQFFDLETGWIAGQLIQILPRDPFFLLTTDGGNTWRRRPVYDEGRVASVEQFWFDSRTAGTLILDRSQSGEAGVEAERLESSTGGESWSIREVSSKPIKPSRARTAETGWRLRPDAASKSYRIERRQGDRWVGSASFLVHAGECKATERVLPEPPPETAVPENPPQVEKPAPGAPKKKPSLERRKP